MILIFLLVVVVVAALPVLIEMRRKPMDAEARSEAPGEFVNLSLGATHYQWHGPVRGPVAVCVHGLTTPSFVWGGMVRGLAMMGYRVLTYDLYGRGYSERPTDPQDSALFVKQLDELLASQGLDEHLTLLGYSMGGAIATAFAATHPERVRQLILLAPAGMGMKPSILRKLITEIPLLGDWLMLALFPLQHRRNCEAERKLPSSVPGIVDLQLRELGYRGFVPAVLSSLRGCLSEPMQEAHRKVHRAGIPVLAVWARQDAVIPISAMGQLTEWSRNAKQDVIEEAGHGLVYTHTDEILAQMSEVLREGLN